MLAFDCFLETHEDVHFTAENDDSLIEKIRQHCHQYHPEMSEEEIREMFSAGAYDPEARVTPSHTLARFGGAPADTSSPIDDLVGGMARGDIGLADQSRPPV